MEILMQFIGGLLALCLALLITALPVMLLWNWLMPFIFGLPVLGFWQSFGLCVLCKGLFGNDTSVSSSK